MWPRADCVLGGGDTAVGYSVEDMDLTADSSARLLQGRGGPGSAQVGRSPASSSFSPWVTGRGSSFSREQRGRPSCCSQVQVLGPVHGGSFGRLGRLVSGLAGATPASLNVPNRLLAVVGTERGIWVSQSAAGGDRFPGAHRLSSANQLPQSLDAIALSGESLVAWTARQAQVTADGPRTIYISRGTAQQAPRANTSP